MNTNTELNTKLSTLDTYRNKGFSNSLLILIVYMATVTKYIIDPMSIFMLFVLGILTIILIPEIFYFYKKRKKIFKF